MRLSLVGERQASDIIDPIQHNLDFEKVPLDRTEASTKFSDIRIFTPIFRENMKLFRTDSSDIDCVPP